MFCNGYTVFEAERILEAGFKPLGCLHVCAVFLYAFELLGTPGNNEASQQDLISWNSMHAAFSSSMALLTKESGSPEKDSPLFAVPVAVLVSMWTNEVHWLYYSEYELDLSILSSTEIIQNHVFLFRIFSKRVVFFELIY